MARKQTETPTPDVAPSWTPEQLMKVRHMGASIIGQQMFDAAQAYFATTGGGLFGPAIVSDDPQYSQAAPVLVKAR